MSRAHLGQARGFAVATLVTAFAAGVVFAIGLGVAGMTQPAKVIGFLDFTGAWDPSLAYVMAAALAVTFVAYRAILRLRGPLLGSEFHLPTRKEVSFRLVAGAAIFGVGWGLAGLCPGPALVALVTAAPSVLLFVAAMTAGTKIAGWLFPDPAR